MATYRYTNTAVNGLCLKLNVRPLYGSSRLGSLRKEEELHSLPAFDPVEPHTVQQVDLNYELTDHLGNVCAVVTGRLLDGNGGGTPKQAELLSAQGYESFGSLLPGRNYSSSSYAHGFNGKRKDDEFHGATGTVYDFDARMLDVRLGRWLSVDPLAAADPDWTPYRFGYNNPLYFIDPNGMREDGWTVDVETGETNRINDHGGSEVQFINYVKKGENGGLVHMGQQVIEGSEFHVGKHSEGYGASRFNLWKDMPSGLKGAYDNLPYEYDWSDLKMRYHLLEGGGVLGRALQGLERDGIAEPLTADNYWSHYGHTLGNMQLMGTYVPIAAGLAAGAQSSLPNRPRLSHRYTARDVAEQFDLGSPSSFRGASPRSVQRFLERNGWTAQPAKANVKYPGIRLTNGIPGHQIRIMPGGATRSIPIKQGPHMIINGGSTRDLVIPLSGNPMR